MPRVKRKEEKKRRLLHTPHHRVPKPLKELRARYGFRFVHGSHGAIEAVHVKPKSKVMIIGDHHYGNFVHALSHSASRKTQHVYSHIVPKGNVVSDNSPDLKDILTIIKDHKPDVIMFAFKMVNWPARKKIYEVSNRANPKRFFASMPEITMDAVKEILPAETKVMEAETISLSKLLEQSRGKELLIKTISENKEYYLKALIPKGTRNPIHCDVPTPGTVFNLPSGETFFSPKKMHGQIYFPSGSIVGDMGIVKSGIHAKFENNELHGVEWTSLHDKHIVNHLLQRLDAMNSFKCSELGIGTHPDITLKKAGVNPLLITKVVNTLNLGFGKPRATKLGNVRDNNFLNIVVPKSFVQVGSRALIENLG